jgi:glycosyltransferase involved in cell wall biosynthesis
MKILVVTPYCAPVYGGPSKSVDELVQGMASLGIEVDLITTVAGFSDPTTVSLNQWVHHDKYRTMYFKCWYQNDFIISVSLIQWLVKNISRYDIVQTHTIFAPLISFVQRICMVYRIPYVVNPHGMLEPWALSYKSWKKKPYLNHVEIPALRRAAIIRTLTSFESLQVKSLTLNKNVVVVPNGINFQHFADLPCPEIFFAEFPRTRNKINILFLGRIDPKKGLDLLAQSFSKVHAKFPQTHLIIAGSDNTGSFLSKAQKFFEDQNCLNSVTFTGLLSGKLKYSVLAAANLYVAPSYSEGFSISVLEGMAAGLPCIITKGCNFPEAESYRAACIIDSNADALTDALMKYLSTPEMAKIMGERARHFVFKNYTWEECARKMIQVSTEFLEDSFN